MRDMFHRAIDGEPVGMDIENRHEDGDLQALFVQDLVFHDLLDGYDRAVSRCDDQSFGIIGEATVRTTEEIQNQEKKISAQ